MKRLAYLICRSASLFGEGQDGEDWAGRGWNMYRAELPMIQELVAAGQSCDSSD